MPIASLLLVHIVAQSLQLQDVIVQSPPAIVSEAGAPAVPYTLSNGGTQPITAWQVNVRLTLSNGKVVNRGQSKDGFDTYALGKPNDVVINPEGSVFGQMVLIDDLGLEGKLTVADVQQTVAYAVFADGTAVGDEAGITDVFHQRALEAEALAVVAAALRAGLAKGSGRGVARRPAGTELDGPDRRRQHVQTGHAEEPSACTSILHSHQVRRRQMITCGNGC